MNISNIKIGNEYKNYKELCKWLEIPCGEGNKKKAQITEMSRFFEWKKDGNKYIITKIYNFPKTKKIKRERNIMLESLLLNLLSYSDNGELLVSKSYLLKSLKMINDNYTFGKRAPHLLANYLDVNIQNVNEFYDLNDRMLERQLENTLYHLKSRSLIMHKEVRMVCVAESYINTNSNGDLIIDIYDTKDQYDIEQIEMSVDKPQILRKYRPATEEEEKYIMAIEYEELRKSEIINKQELIRYGKWHEWQKNVNKRIREEKNIAFYYNGYEIIANPEHVNEELEIMNQEQEKELGIKMNKGLQEKILKNTIKRFNTVDNLNENRKSKSYVKEHTLIINTAIDITTENKVKEMQNHILKTQ